MISKIIGVTKNHIAKWAYFYANVFFNKLFYKVREQENLETMTNSFGIKKCGSMQVCD